jgi:hypothetical protein
VLFIASSCSNNLGFYKKRYDNGYYITKSMPKFPIIEKAAAQKINSFKKSTTEFILRDSIEGFLIADKNENSILFDLYKPFLNETSSNSKILFKNKSFNKKKLKGLRSDEVSAENPDYLIGKHDGIPAFNSIFLNLYPNLYFIFGTISAIFAALIFIYLVYMLFDGLAIGLYLAFPILSAIILIAFLIIAFLIVINSY